MLWAGDGVSEGPGTALEAQVKDFSSRASTVLSKQFKWTAL